MKVVFVGADLVTDHVFFNTVEQSGFDVTEVVYGRVVGGDSVYFGRNSWTWAKTREVTVHMFFADRVKEYNWRKRSKQIVKYVDAAVIFYDRSSSEILDFVEQANCARLKVFLKVVE